jgi:hypothetical protein
MFPPDSRHNPINPINLLTLRTSTLNVEEAACFSETPVHNHNVTRDNKTIV